MTIPRFQASDSADAIYEALSKWGCAVVENALPAERRKRIFEELRPHLQATSCGDDPFSGFQTRRTGRLIERSQVVRDVVRWPLTLGLVGRVLSRSSSFQIHASQVIAIGPGETAQTLHRDRWAFDAFPFPSDWEVHCGTMWALTDFTALNGATRVVPGSHREPDRSDYPQSGAVPAEMPAGSVLLYAGGLYHGGGANDSNEVRYGLNLTFSAAWLRQEENQYLSIPFEVARELPEDLLRLMGFARGGYALGYWGDLKDPIERVRPDLASDGMGQIDEFRLDR